MLGYFALWQPQVAAEDNIKAEGFISEKLWSYISKIHSPQTVTLFILLGGDGEGVEITPLINLLTYILICHLYVENVSCQLSHPT